MRRHARSRRVRVLDARLLPAACGAWGAAVWLGSGYPVEPDMLMALVVAALVIAVPGCLSGRRIAPPRSTSGVVGRERFGRSTGRVVVAVSRMASVAALGVGMVAVPYGVLGGDPVRAALREARGSDEIRRFVASWSEEPREVPTRHGTAFVTEAMVHEVQWDGKSARGRATVVLWWNHRPEALGLGENAVGERTVLAGTVEAADGGRPFLRVAATLGRVGDGADGLGAQGSGSPDHPAPAHPPQGSRTGAGGGFSGGPVPPAAVQTLDAAKEATAARARDVLPGDVAALVLGLSYGDDSSLSEETADHLKIAGLTHLTAVSGSNVAVVFLVGVHVVRWTRCPRGVSISVGLVTVLAYLVLVGPEPSIARATVMGVLGGVSLASGRGGGTGSALWLSVVVLLAIDPGMATDAGFVLSVLATAGIVVHGPSACRIASLFLWRWLAEVVSVTVVASVWCLPYLIHLSGFLGTYTVFANVAVASVIPGGTVCGLLAICLSPWDGPARLLIRAAGGAARWVETVGHIVADLPGARWETGDNPVVVGTACLVSLGLCWAISRADPARRITMRDMPDNLAMSLAVASPIAAPAAAGPSSPSSHRSK